MRIKAIATLITIFIGVAMLSLVFFMPSVLFPAVLGKVVVFRLSIEAALALYAVLLWRDYERYRPRLNVILIAIALFVAAMIIAALQGTSPYTSWWGTLNRMDGIFTFVHFVAFFVVLSGIYTRREQWIAPLRMFVGVALVLAVIALYGLVTDDNIALVNGNRAFLAQTLLFGGGFGILLGQWERVTTRRYALYTVAGVLLGTLVLTGTRGAILGVVVGLGVLAIWQAVRTKRRAIRTGIIGGAIIGVVALASIFVFKESVIVQGFRPIQRLSQLSLEESSVATRLNAWETAIDAIAQRPVLGWGPEQYVNAFNSNFDPNLVSIAAASVWFDRAHNVVLGTAVELGTLGLIAYLALLGSGFLFAARLYRQDARTGMVVIATLIAYIIFNLTLFDTIYSLIPFYLLLAFLGAMGTTEHGELQQDKPALVSRRYMTQARLGVGIFGIMLVSAGVYGNVLLLPPARAARDGELSSASMEPFALSVGHISEALARPSYAVRDISLVAAQALDRYITDESRTDEQFQAFVRETIAGLEKAHARNTLDRKVRTALINAYGMAGRFDEAEELYKDTAGRFPTIPNVYFNGARIALDNSMAAVAVERSTKGLSLNPDAGMLHWQHGIVLALADETEKALESFEVSVGLGHIPEPQEALQVALTYGSIDQSDMARTWHERVIRRAENQIENSEDTLATNTAYIHSLLALGRTIQAQEHLEMLLENRPDWEPQLAAFVESLRTASE